MPFVKIDVIRGRRSPEQLKKMGDVIQQVLIDTFAAPERDRYQVCELYLNFYRCDINLCRSSASTSHGKSSAGILVLVLNVRMILSASTFLRKEGIAIRRWLCMQLWERGWKRSVG